MIVLMCIINLVQYVQVVCDYSSAAKCHYSLLIRNVLTIKCYVFSLLQLHAQCIKLWFGKASY